MMLENLDIEDLRSFLCRSMESIFPLNHILMMAYLNSSCIIHIRHKLLRLIANQALYPNDCYSFKIFSQKVILFLKQHCHYANYFLNSCSEIAITLKAQYLNIFSKAIGEGPHHLTSKPPQKLQEPVLMKGGLSIQEPAWWKQTMTKKV